MSFKVRIAQADRTIDVPTGATILEAALAQGVAYPHGCRSGNCGACKSRAREAGEVDLAPYSDYALTEEERAQGLILACRAMPWSDAAVAWLEADEVVGASAAAISSAAWRRSTNLTHDIKRVRLEIVSGGPFDFSAGPVCGARVASLPARDYSMANRPDEPVLEFHVRAHERRRREPLHRARPSRSARRFGSRDRFGSSCLREHHTGPILGDRRRLRPRADQVDRRDRARRGARQPIHLYFGVRDERDLYLEEHFTRARGAHPNLRFTPVLSEPAAPTARRNGFVHEAAAADLARPRRRQGLSRRTAGDGRGGDGSCC